MGFATSCSLMIAALLGACSGLCAQPQLDLQGDPAITMDLCGDWQPPGFTWDGKRKKKILEAPFHCSECAAAELYEDATKLPEAPSRLLQQPAEVVSAWCAEHQKSDPIVISLEKAVLVVMLPDIPAARIPKPLRNSLFDQFQKKVGPRLTPHHRAHLLAYEYLRSEREFLSIMDCERGRLGAGPGISVARAEYFVFDNEEVYQEFGRHFFGMFGKALSWWWKTEGALPIGSVNGTKLKDAQLRARFRYLTQHIMLHQYSGFTFRLPVWLAAGLGHWTERRTKGHKNSYMVMGTPAAKAEWGWDGANWHREVYNLVNTKKSQSFIKLSLMTKEEELTPLYRAQAWSMTHYLMGLDAKAYGVFLNRILTKKASETPVEAVAAGVEKAYGCLIPELEAGWREWVMAGRGKKPKK